MSFGKEQVLTMPYCDNVRWGDDARLMNDSCNAVCEGLQSLGFSLHEEQEATSSMETLGVRCVQLPNVLGASLQPLNMCRGEWRSGMSVFRRPQPLGYGNRPHFERWLGGARHLCLKSWRIVLANRSSDLFYRAAWPAEK